MQALTFGAIFGYITQYWYIVAVAVLAAVLGIAWLFVRRRTRAKTQEKRREVNCMVFDGNLRSPIKSIPEAEIENFAAIRPRIIGKQKVYLIEAISVIQPEVTEVEEKVPVAANTIKLKASIRKKYATELRAVDYLGSLSKSNGNGYLTDELPLTQSASGYKYKQWSLNPVPSDPQAKIMTPTYLYQCIHWEEQAKIARVKASALSQGLKIGVALVAIGASVIALFLIVAVITDKT